MDGVDLQRRSLFLLRSTAHKLTELRRALRRNGGGGAFRWPPRTNRASRAPGTPAPASSRASAPVFLELIECALPAHAPQDGRPHLMLSHLSSYFSVSGGLLKLAAGPARRPGLIYCRSCLADETEMSRCSLAKHSVLRGNQAHNCSAATREGGGAPRRGLHASISSVTAAPEGAGQRTRPPVAIFRFGTRSFVSRFFLDSTSPATDDPRATSAS